MPIGVPRCEGLSSRTGRCRCQRLPSLRLSQSHAGFPPAPRGGVACDALTPPSPEDVARQPCGAAASETRRRRRCGEEAWGGGRRGSPPGWRPGMGRAARASVTRGGSRGAAAGGQSARWRSRGVPSGLWAAIGWTGRDAGRIRCGRDVHIPRYGMWARGARVPYLSDMLAQAARSRRRAVRKGTVSRGGDAPRTSRELGCGTGHRPLPHTAYASRAARASRMASRVWAAIIRRRAWSAPAMTTRAPMSIHRRA